MEELVKKMSGPGVSIAKTEEIGHGTDSSAQWDDIFDQAEKLGISFILLAGGEPLMRRDVVEFAGRHKKVIFPVFTNGTICLLYTSRCV